MVSEAASALAIAGMGVAVAGALPLMLGIVLRLPDEDEWSARLRHLRTLGGVSLAAVGLSVVGSEPAPAAFPLSGSPSFVFAAGLLLPAAAWLPSLCRPHGVRDALAGLLAPDPGRRAAALLAWTALVPFGGLATPLWRRWRRRVLAQRNESYSLVVAASRSTSGRSARKSRKLSW